MKERRAQPLWPDPTLPLQVKEEEGWRQGCTRAVLRRKQFGEAVAGKAQGSCQLLQEAASSASGCSASTGHGNGGVLLPWGHQGAAGAGPWSRRRRRRETGPAGVALSAQPLHLALVPHLGFLLAVAKETKPRLEQNKKNPHLTCVISTFLFSVGG